MVCLGNICRSPLAEGIMQNKIDQHDLEWRVDSAGTSSWHVGEKPDRRSIMVADKYGIDISNQRARQFKAVDLQEFDLVFAMDSSNYQDILKMANSPEDEQKVEMIMNRLQPGFNQNVPDPYYDSDGFELVFRMLNEACEKVIERNI
jgi:protein-tyrosine phosphatase